MQPAAVLAVTTAVQMHLGTNMTLELGVSYLESRLLCIAVTTAVKTHLGTSLTLELGLNSLIC